MLFYKNNEIYEGPEVDLITYLKKTVRTDVDYKVTNSLNDLKAEEHVIYMEDPSSLTHEEKISLDGMGSCYGRDLQDVIGELFYTRDHMILLTQIEQYMDVPADDDHYSETTYIYLHYYVITQENPLMRKFKINNLLNS